MTFFEDPIILLVLLIGVSGLFYTAKALLRLSREGFTWKRFFLALIDRDYAICKLVNIRTRVSFIYLGILCGTLALLLILGPYFIYPYPTADWITKTILLIFCIPAIFLGFAPTRIAADNDTLHLINFGYRRKIIISDIETVHLIEVSDVPNCKLGSYGLFGYWGFWEDAEHGRFWAHFGRLEGRFFVRLIDGRGFMLGCKDPQLVVDYLLERSDELSKIHQIGTVTQRRREATEKIKKFHKKAEEIKKRNEKLLEKPEPIEIHLTPQQERARYNRYHRNIQRRIQERAEFFRRELERFAAGETKPEKPKRYKSK